MRKLLVAFLIVAVATTALAGGGFVWKGKRAVTGGPAWNSVASDNFNRANENPLDNNYWTVTPNLAAEALKIVDNLCLSTTASVANIMYWTGASPASWNDNQYSQVTLPTTPTQGLQSRYLLVRYTTAGTAYVAIFTMTDLLFYKAISGSWTQIGATETFSVTSGDTVRFRAQGTTLTVSKNGTDAFERTGQTDVTSGRPGIGIYDGPDLQSAMDDWDGGIYE